MNQGLAYLINAGRPFTAKEAQDKGVSHALLSFHCQSGRLERLCHCLRKVPQRKRWNELLEKRGVFESSLANQCSNGMTNYGLSKVSKTLFQKAKL